MEEDSGSGEQFASQLRGLTSGSPDAASSGRADTALAAHPAVSTMVAPRPSTEGNNGTGAQFASQFGGLTSGSADADAWRPAGPANLPAATESAWHTAALPATSPAVAETTLDEAPLPDAAGADSKAATPKSPARQSVPAGVTSSKSAPAKRAATGQGSPQKASREETPSGEPTPMAAVAAEPAPSPEIAATLAAVTDDPTCVDGPEAPVEAPAPHSAPANAAQPAPTVTAAAGAPQAGQEMAFAARVQPIQSADQTALPAEMASTAAVASASKKIVAAADDETATPADAQGLLAPTTTAVDRSAEPTRAPSPAAPLAAGAAHHAEAPTSPADSLPKASAPLKDISLQVSQPGKERVDVRVVQQGSEVHVSVHSGDASLNSGLRQGLSDLQSRLEENGYRAEMWRPAGSAAPLTPTPGAHAAPGQSRGGDAQPQSGGSQQNGGRRNPQQSNQPRWVEELESSLTGGEKSIGGSYGVSS